MLEDMSSFTPAAGRFAPTFIYDPLITLTRERLWRTIAVAHLAPRRGDVIVDVGCGTGSLAVLIGRIQPQARVIGVDPDAAVLAIVARKADAVGVQVDWRTAMGDDLGAVVSAESADAMVSSLVLHQCPMPTKQAIIAAMFAALRPGGRLVIADYGWQRTWLMRTAFRIVQLADGKTDTQPNADGILPDLLSEANFQDMREADVVSTISGSISIYVASKK
ncbi:methyltransferase [Mycobacterium liflandii 128FXT]|uniref:Methyltransferase n=1 Tax=Mycobacterium liflandii (strain 128FXT) TaxID=459424 RepID=L7V4C4_MYCL1|nr:class I SAM-dependent methyltransferase [Mycobacterium liflandii]AGC61022.1 methyltransferase [Mycobacterium liflandii 128FXT]